MCHLKLPVSIYKRSGSPTETRCSESVREKHGHALTAQQIFTQADLEEQTPEKIPAPAQGLMRYRRSPRGDGL